MNAFMIGLLIVLVYFLVQLGDTEAQAKTVTASINGLVDNYTTTSVTVGEFLDELNIDQQLISVTPAPQELLDNHSHVVIITQPIEQNALVALNMQDTLEQVAEAARQKAEEAKKRAEEIKRQAEVDLIPKSPVYLGTASWYSFGNGMNAASTQFPRGTRLRVIAINSGKSIIVKINDYGPEAWTDVMLDLNKPAFAKLAPLGAGKIQIRYYKI